MNAKGGHVRRCLVLRKWSRKGLEGANLVAVVWRGREKLHFLNPVPLQEIYERWIAKFEKPRLKAIAELKKKLEKSHG